MPVTGIKDNSLKQSEMLLALSWPTHCVVS